MTLSKTFLDSNIILYLLDTHDAKRIAAKELMDDIPCINAQVLVEVGNVCQRKFGFTKHQVSELWFEVMAICEVADISETTISEAIYLTEKYDFQLFDAIIVSGALEAGCSVLYSEDMQHQLVVESRLTIINPFLMVA